MKTSNCFLVALLLSAGVGTTGAEITFSEPARLPAGNRPAAVASADLTGDSHLDLIIVHSSSDDAYVYVGDGGGGFQLLQVFSIGNFPQGITTADFDGDGKADIATTAVPFNSGTAAAWLGNGDGTFQAAAGSYDSHSGNLAGARDAEIAASGRDCP